MRTRTLLLLSLLSILPGCSPDFYKESADRQVYQILRDRKYDTVGYNPQALVGEAAIRSGAPGAASAVEARATAADSKGPAVIPAPGASAVPAKAYEPIPVTVLPPIQPAAVEVAPERDPYGPLGPWLDETNGVGGPNGGVNGGAGGAAPGAIPMTPAPPSSPSPSSDPATAPGTTRASAARAAVRAAARLGGAAMTGSIAADGAHAANGTKAVNGMNGGNGTNGPGTAAAPAVAGAAGGPSGFPSYEPNEARSAIGKSSERFVLGPPSPGPTPVALDLFGAIAYGVQHSRAYRTQMDDVYLSALDVTLQRHLFEPRPFSQLGLQYTGGQRETDYKSALTATANAGVRQQLPYGGEVVAQALVSFVNAISDNAANGESAQVALSGSIPLLRGAGLVNLEPLISSERAVVYQIRAFEDFRRGFAVDVTTQYYRVLTALQSVNNRRQNVQNLRDLLDRARVLFGAPKDLRARQSFLEVQRAEQSLLQGQDDLVTAQLNYLNTLDDFKLLIGMDVRQELSIVPVSLDAIVPEVIDQDPVTVADRFRLDLQTARDRVEDSRRQIAVAQNGLLPDLNLTAQGQAGNPANTLLRQFNSSSLTYSAGLTLDLPLDRVAERNVYRRALISYYASRRSYEDLHEQVAADVRTSVRAIRQAQNSVLIQRRSIELAQRRLENASLLLRIGGSTSTRDYVEAQSSLLSAQDSYDRAVASLQVQILTFLRQTGMLRVDPTAGTLGRAMDRSMPPPINDLGEPVPLTDALRPDAARPAPPLPPPPPASPPPPPPARGGP